MHSGVPACLNTYCVLHLHQSHPLSSQGRVSGPKMYSSGSSPGQVLTPQDAGQGHRGAFPPQKEVTALPSPFPVAGLLTIPGGKLGPPACPTPCPLLKYLQFRARFGSTYTKEVPAIPVLKPKLPRLLFTPCPTAALPHTPSTMRQPSPHSFLHTQPLPEGEEARRELGGWNKEEIPAHILQAAPATWAGLACSSQIQILSPLKGPPTAQLVAVP